MSPANLIEEIRKSLDANNILDKLTEIKVLKGGKNNQTYKVDLRTGASYVVKKYFKHPHDLRNRQNAEFLFTTYANKVASNFVPRVLFSDAMNGMIRIARMIPAHSNPMPIGGPENSPPMRGKRPSVAASQGCAYSPKSGEKTSSPHMP